MTKKIGPAQETHLKALGSASTRLMRVREKEDEIMREVHGLIRDGFKLNISGIKLAEAGRLSLPRVYQIQKDVEPSGDIQDQAAQASAH
jgi:hypothetical protein